LPGPGFHTFTTARFWLERRCGTRISSRKFHAMCAELGIEIYPLVYEGKTYKAMWRWLTDAEVQRILELYHMRLEARRERKSLRED
jgi:hypothetical protein